MPCICNKDNKLKKKENMKFDDFFDLFKKNMMAFLLHSAETAFDIKVNVLKEENLSSIVEGRERLLKLHNEINEIEKNLDPTFISIEKVEALRRYREDILRNLNKHFQDNEKLGEMV